MKNEDETMEATLDKTITDDMRRVRKRTNNRDFVVAYMTCESIDDVASTTGLSKSAVYARVTYLRKIGVKLPKRYGTKSKFGRELEVAQLNSLISKYEKGRK